MAIYDLKREIGEKLIALMGDQDRRFLDFVLMKSSAWIIEEKSFEVIKDFLTKEKFGRLCSILDEPIAGIERFDNAMLYVSNIMKERYGELLNRYE